MSRPLIVCEQAGLASVVILDEPSRDARGDHRRLLHLTGRRARRSADLGPHHPLAAGGSKTTMLPLLILLAGRRDRRQEGRRSALAAEAKIGPMDVRAVLELRRMITRGARSWTESVFS